MIKKIFGTMAIVTAMFAGHTAYNTQNKEEIFINTLSNVEALANTEINSECPNGCLSQYGEYCYCYKEYRLKEKQWD